MRHAFHSFVLALALGFSPAALRADVMVANSLNLTQLLVTSSSGTVQLTLNAAAFGEVFDSLGESDFGFDPGPVSASTSAATSLINPLANWAGAADAGALTASSSSGVNIPGNLVASAGTVPGGSFGDLSGMLEIVDSSGASNPVTVNLSAALSGSQDLTTDALGQLAMSEVIFNLIVGSTNELAFDSPLQIGPSSSLSSPISMTLTGSDATLLTNTPYFFDAQVDAESFGINAPEPSSLWLAGTICLAFLTRFRRKR